VKSDSVGFSLSFLHCSSVCHSSTDFGNLGNPPTINFTFDLKVKSHVSTPCLLWWFTVRHGFIDVMMRHARFGCTITRIMSSIRYWIAANKTFLGSFAWTLPRLLLERFVVFRRASVNSNMLLLSSIPGHGFSQPRAADGAYFSRATTNSGAQSSARFISESGKVQIARLADSAYWAARVVAASTDP